MSLSLPSDPPPPRDDAGAAAAAVEHTIDHLFRREAGRLVAILAAKLGAAHLHLAEDVVQDALLRAMQVWPFTGIPDNPSAWLLATARNRAFDLLRRRQAFAQKAGELAPLIEDTAREALAATPPQFEDEIADRQLRMMFVCCQPALPVDAQVALVLKTLCGFDEREIAAAFLATEDAIAKKLVRARKFLRDADVAIELPPAAELAPRVDTLLHALYLLFNEGYKASHGDSLLRADLCAEAIRLGELLAAHAVGDRPETHALLALMHLHAARLPARMTDDGSLLTLEAQDRTRWDRSQIQRGVAHLEHSSTGTRVTRWHAEAGIALCHALAPRFEDTSWEQIAELYDLLHTLAPSPIVALNRAVAIARLRGAAAGLEAFAPLRADRALQRYHLFHAVEAELLRAAGREDDARAALQRALALTQLTAERELIAQRLEGGARSPNGPGLPA